MGASLIAYDAQGHSIQFGSGMGDAWYEKYDRILWRPRVRCRVTPRKTHPRPCVRGPLLRWCTFRRDQDGLRRFKSLHENKGRWVDFSLLDKFDWTRIVVRW